MQAGNESDGHHPGQGRQSRKFKRPQDSGIKILEGAL